MHKHYYLHYRKESKIICSNFYVKVKELRLSINAKVTPIFTGG